MHAECNFHTHFDFGTHECDHDILGWDFPQSVNLTLKSVISARLSVIPPRSVISTRTNVIPTRTRVIPTLTSVISTRTRLITTR
jgi:hypothetical protein